MLSSAASSMVCGIHGSAEFVVLIRHIVYYTKSIDSALCLSLNIVKLFKKRPFKLTEMSLNMFGKPVRKLLFLQLHLVMQVQKKICGDKNAKQGCCRHENPLRDT